MPRQTPLGNGDDKTPNAKLLVVHCPKCRRIDRAEEEEQSGSSGRWFLCARRGLRYTRVARR
jgi:hypothetical protein